MVRLIFAALICLQLVAVTAAQEKPKKPRMDENEETISKFMRAKLQHAQKMIESLATEDFDAMAKSSQEMSLLTLAESWQVLQTPDYLHESMAFRRSAADPKPAETTLPCRERMPTVLGPSSRRAIIQTAAAMNKILSPSSMSPFPTPP